MSSSGHFVMPGGSFGIYMREYSLAGKRHLMISPVHPAIGMSFGKIVIELKLLDPMFPFRCQYILTDLLSPCIIWGFPDSACVFGQVEERKVL